jgi:hypothetical protein
VAEDVGAEVDAVEDAEGEVLEVSAVHMLPLQE